MSDLISRQVAIDEILGQPPEPHYPSWYAEQIKHLPTAQPEPSQIARDIATIIENEQDMRVILKNAHPERMRGRWVPVTNGRGGFECDQCHNYAPSYQDGVEWLSDFCPNCGADMRGEQDG